MSPKQEALCWLVGHGFAILRAIQSSAAMGSVPWLLEHRDYFGQGFALADLLHRVHCSITEPDFEENDVTFINFAIPHYLRELGDEIEPSVVKRFVALYDTAPPEIKERLTWHPSHALRLVAASTEA
jgi:hypothetical protein